MSEVTIEYMAGFFDADGNVNLREGNVDAIRFANTNKDVLINKLSFKKIALSLSVIWKKKYES